LDLNSTSRYLFVGGSDNIINAWDLKSRTIKKTYKVVYSTFTMQEDHSLSFLAHLSWAFLIACCSLSVQLSVRLLVHFQLPFQNHWANFNQGWHKLSLDEGHSKLFKWRAISFLWGGDCKRVNKEWKTLKVWKMFFSRTSKQSNLIQIILCWREFNFDQIMGQVFCKRGSIIKWKNLL
jgi:hypothetical protein